MAGAIHLRVLTEAGVAFEEEVISIVAPGELGYLGILHNHAPLITTLRTGTLRWNTSDGHEQHRLIGDGVLEIRDNACTILTSSVQADQSAPIGHARI